MLANMSLLNKLKKEKRKPKQNIHIFSWESQTEGCVELKSHIHSTHQTIPPSVGPHFVSSLGTQSTDVSIPEQKENENPSFLMHIQTAPRFL